MAWLCLVRTIPVSPGAPLGPTLYACRTPPLSAMFSPRVRNPFTCIKKTGWRPAGPGPLLPHGARAGYSCRTTTVLVTCLHSGCWLVPKRSCRTDRSCTATAVGSVELRSYSTSPACCHSCQSSDLRGSRRRAHLGTCILSPRPCFHCPTVPSSKASSVLGCLWTSSSS